MSTGVYEVFRSWLPFFDFSGLGSDDRLHNCVTRRTVPILKCIYDTWCLVQQYEFETRGFGGLGAALAI